MTLPPNLTYRIAIYDRESERLVDEIALYDPPVAELRRLFEHGDDHYLVLCYDIGDRQRPFLERLTGRLLHDPDHLYFLECDGSR